jgi:hypothetical protein
MYTVEDLETARAELDCCVAAFDRAQTSYHEQLSAQIRAASRKVREIENYLRMHGLIELNPQQRLQAALDSVFPNAQHGDIVQYQDQRYRLRYFPEAKCRSGWGVRTWGKRWEQLKD